jgi:membrane fusion protein, multidrug efflux system
MEASPRSRPRPGSVPASLAVVFLVSLSACGRDGAESAAPVRKARLVPVTTVTVKAGPLVYEVAAIGSLEAYQTVTVPARVAGPLEKLALEEGQEVKPTDVLAVIDGERRALAVAQVEAMITKNVAAAERAAAQTRSAQASLGEGQANLARRATLRARAPGTVSDEEYASFQAQVKRFEAAVAEAKAAEGEVAAGINDARAQLAIAKKSLSDSEVRSPIAGVVEAKRVAVGQYVKEGDAIAVLVDAKQLRVRFKVPERDSTRLTDRAKVKFRVQAMPQREFRARLIHVAGASDVATRMIECLAEVIDADPALKPGFFASVTVEVGGAEAAITVPEEAVLPSERGFIAYVLLDAKAKRRDIAVGMRTKSGDVEVLSGLAVGDMLIVKGSNVVEDGTAVTMMGAKPAEKPEGPPAAGAPPSRPSAAPAGPPTGGPR